MGVPKIFATFVDMYIRKKKNSSGAISVQVIDKSTGQYRVHKAIGSSNDAAETEKMVRQGKEYIRHYGGQLDMIAQFEQEGMRIHKREETLPVYNDSSSRGFCSTIRSV